ncbi:MAG: phage integrase N-terminal SAM-like domain-containing protein [Kiritimatiellia bacterium]|nr:phage integrase N-terminal SAM-like domain-containing protein [Kiritimatiellia bacterium]MDP7023999.1 phage integrase N-terminal SAM-like domain-containing protein [Kiritimatiellia bacterium]
MTTETEKPKLIDRLRNEIRVRHYSIRTEHSYCQWVVRYCKFHNLRHPEEMGAPEINKYLTHLATDRNVAVSTQNQACCAIVFLYKHVLGKDPGDFSDVIRAKRLKGQNTGPQRRGAVTGAILRSGVRNPIRFLGNGYLGGA